MNIPTITIPALQTKDGNTRSLRLEPLAHDNENLYASMLYKAYQDYSTVQFLPVKPLNLHATQYQCAKTASDYIKYNNYCSDAAKTWLIKQNYTSIGFVSFVAQNLADPQVFGRTLLLLPEYQNQGLGQQLHIVSYDVMFRALKAPAILLQCAAQNKAALSVKNTLQGWEELGPIDVSGKMINPETTILLRSQLTHQNYLNNTHNITVPNYQIHHADSWSNRMGCE